MSESKTTTLKPCPFCGCRMKYMTSDPAKAVGGDDILVEHIIIHDTGRQDCLPPLSKVLKEGEDFNMVHVWNRRMP